MDQDPLRITLHPRFLPMVVAPKAWLAWDSGSYMVHSSTSPSFLSRPSR
jgi:DNA-directed RNA polymerase